jgi:hypothetical protein
MEGQGLFRVLTVQDSQLELVSIHSRSKTGYWLSKELLKPYR